MKRILEAFRRHPSVFVELPDTAACERFRQEAAAAGFCFGDGAAPTEREMGRVMAVHADGTIRYPGAMGMAAFQCRARPILRFES